jgi:hypothetical protein
MVVVNGHTVCSRSKCTAHSSIKDGYAQLNLSGGKYDITVKIN